MALTGITTREPNGTIGGIWLDAVVRELHTLRSEVTRHPLESGSDIVDHVRVQPDVVVLECVVTNSPLTGDEGQQKVPKSHADGARVVYQGIDVPAPTPGFNLGFSTVPLGAPGAQSTATIRRFEPKLNRVHNVFEELRAIKEQKRIVDIRTSLTDYVDMVIEEVQIPVEAGEGGNVLRFSVTAVSIRTVASKVADAPQPKVERAKTTKDAGRVPAKAEDDGTIGAEKTSLLHRGGTAIGAW